MKLPSVQEMRELERRTIDEYGITALILMENAGLGTVVMAEKLLGSCEDSFCPIFIGPGNNGGDGLVMGRHLCQRGCQPLFFFLQPPENFRGEAAENFKIVEKLRLPYHIIDSVERVSTISYFIKQRESVGLRCYAVVDAIFGIGLSRDISGCIAEVIAYINSPAVKGFAPIISLDTPSGLDTDTGEIRGSCVRADYTAAYGCAKPGHFLFGSSAWTGHLEVIDIGIPPEVLYRSSIKTELTTLPVLMKHCARLCREGASHKGSHGHALLLAGNAGTMGAAVLAARGALRAGTGLLTIAATTAGNTILQSTVPEAMTLPLDHPGPFLSIHHWPQIEANLEQYSCIIIGPGIGQHPETAELVLTVYQKATVPVVIDADGLNILAAHGKTLPSPGGPRIFTPHPGEMARLLNLSTSEIFHDRLGAAEAGCELFADSSHEAIMVLKGIGTIILSNRGHRFINTTGNPGMATGGMGDVLSGIIGGFICQGMKPLPATTTAVYLHGRAADTLYKRSGPGFYASEVADSLPQERQNMLIELYGTADSTRTS